MIEVLRIENLGVIKTAEVELSPGLTVVTGETGAGKTMFVTALDLLLGARSGSHVVRAGEDRAVVEGIFDITGQPDVAERVEDAGGEAEGELIVTRTIPASGRARATAGGRTVPAGLLSDVGRELVSMHGQSEQMTLRSRTRQRELLDSFGGQKLARARQDYAAAYATWTSLKEEHAELTDSATEREQRIEFLETALEKIEEVRPLEGEDVELTALANRLASAHELKTAVASAQACLTGADWDDTANAVDQVNAAAAHLSQAAASDGTLTEHASALTDLGLQLSDRAARLSEYLAGFDELGDRSLEDIEQRRADLGSLSAYGEDTSAVLAFETEAGAELLRLREAGESLATMDAQVEAARTDMLDKGTRLTEQREKAAEEFSQAVGAELAALSMPKASITFAIEEAEPAVHGCDSVSLLFAAHSSTVPGEIGKLASGGELSRVMLAIEVVMARSITFPTFVFDEVDAGVGGRAAIEIGRRLAQLARHSQVIVVTHLAQVAAWADNHVTVSKDDAGEGVVSGVSVLSREEREHELARMLSGLAESDSAREHADELLAIAAQEKSSFDSVKE
ncbi:DNA repair protein RecN [Brevibacterium sp. HMSC07C04]|uniref:DNA repair protein RecN n=1 Tax=Brevibacterium sp. HMSC07C04 TaxID=1581130 RepID=UPI0008A48471|nr:DNA repair protein RecN [Brevibacterium sp. HMSC07C04]OFS26795.1 DNA repair protein RecN [Brevibacterium sp. HMSC07C04]